MNGRWRSLALAVLVAAVVLAVLMRLPRPAVRPAEPAAATRTVDLAITVAEGRTQPEAAAVPLGDRVRLCARNAGRDSVDLALAGYEGRIVMTAIAPGESRCDSFVADRPGEDFAWLIDGRPAGRLTVTGSHLVEGHR